MSDNLPSLLKDNPLLDRPISPGDNDRLGFGELARSLANLILNHPNTSSLILGLEGPWGSGKSSMLRLLQGEFAKGNEESEGVDVIVISFSPWLITNRIALITSFFGQLDQAVDQAIKRLSICNRFRTGWKTIFKRSIKKEVKKTRRALNGFSKVAAVAATATAVVDMGTASAVLAGASATAEKMPEPSDPTLEELKAEITDHLQKIAKADDSFRILVLIDDLDRLDPEDALEILRLVKVVTDFPGISYLLAYDRTALVDAITQHARVKDGNAYLEKIIQHSYKIPPLEPFRLREWLKSELREKFSDEFSDGSQRAEVVLDTWAGRLLTTPRDVKRVLYAVHAMWEQLRNKVDLLDLVWLQMVKERAATGDKNLYTWVTRYLQSLDAIAIGGSVSGAKQEAKELKKILRTLQWGEYVEDGDASEVDLHFLNLILAGIDQSHLGEPRAANEGWTHRASRDELLTYREEKRLSSPWHWRLYFALDTPSHAISDDEWITLNQAAAVSCTELQKSISALLELQSAGRPYISDQLIEVISRAARTETLESPETWITVIVSMADELRHRSKPVRILTGDTYLDTNVVILLRHVFGILNEEQRTDVLGALFSKCSNLSLSAQVLRHQFAASKLPDSSKSDKLFLTDSELELAVSDQMKQFTKLDETVFLRLSSPYDVLFAWKEVSGSIEGPESFLSGLMENTTGMMKALSTLEFITNRDGKLVHVLPERELSSFMDTNKLKSRLQQISKGNTEHAVSASRYLSIWVPIDE
ncbi:MAG: P-loop NTPase fold protein [Candidatus Poribacteria bacterium]|nr:P-loop NTPase fold protein [Candidatus Poribacteria bacterium]